MRQRKRSAMASTCWAPVNINYYHWGFPNGSAGKESSCNAGDTGDTDSGRCLGQEDLLEEEMATHSSILAWKILWTEKRRAAVHEDAESDVTEHMACRYSEYYKKVQNNCSNAG